MHVIGQKVVIPLFLLLHFLRLPRLGRGRPGAGKVNPSAFRDRGKEFLGQLFDVFLRRTEEVNFEGFFPLTRRLRPLCFRGIR